MRRGKRRCTFTEFERMNFATYRHVFIDSNQRDQVIDQYLIASNSNSLQTKITRDQKDGKEGNIKSMEDPAEKFKMEVRGCASDTGRRPKMMLL